MELEIGGREVFDVIVACADAWAGIEREWNVSVRGVIAVKATAFSEAGLPEGSTLGLAHPIALPSDAACVNPSALTHTSGSIVVTDDAGSAGGFVTAHELGHILQLGHGNGLDDDGDGRVDDFCDGTEDPDAAPTGLMAPSGTDSDMLNAYQRALARAAAFVNPQATRRRPAVPCVVGPSCPPVQP